ncbi:NUDIX hydrolase [Halovivax asiaticus JCM 14624]|uniref:NUDIX hydrolase n=1 Tax=Halovivax asiaticus JCM 14624 TaxID=1227490 RepID=M0BNX2_9EURY|nr:NUDIX hydrolase [Halovivax asiaticus]ELZ12187.1 NUDIX hydrolase [Halovivax asiaticus JCM 14624]
MPEPPRRWETRDESVAYSCPGFDVITQTVRLPDGTETDFDYLSEPPSVAILPFTPDGAVVTTQEWRQAVERWVTGVPVGGVESSDADLSAAARRELAEETGYEAETIDPLCTVEPANGLADSLLHLFVARGCRPTVDQSLDRDETIRARERPYDDLKRAVIDGEIRDGRPVLAVSYYELAGPAD